MPEDTRIIGATANSTIDEQYGVKYTKQLQRELQQMESKMEPWVTIMPGCQGKSVELPNVGKLELDDRTQRIQQIVMGDELLIGNRHIKPRSFCKQVPFSNLDDKAYNINVEYNVPVILRELNSALGRKKDEVILGTKYDSTKGYFVKNQVLSAAGTPYNATTAGGALGTNYVGLNCDGLVDLKDAPGDDESYESCGIVPYDFKWSGTKADTGALLDKFVRGIQLHKKKHSYVPGMHTLVQTLTSFQKSEIQMWESAQNKNYGFGNLVEGYKNVMLGVNLLEVECLPFATVGTGQSAKTFRICPLYIKEMLYFGFWINPQVKIDGDLQAYNGAGQVKYNVSLGATRTCEEAVVQIQCVEKVAS